MPTKLKVKLVRQNIDLVDIFDQKQTEQQSFDGQNLTFYSSGPYLHQPIRENSLPNSFDYYDLQI